MKSSNSLYGWKSCRLSYSLQLSISIIHNSNLQLQLAANSKNMKSSLTYSNLWKTKSWVKDFNDSKILVLFAGPKKDYIQRSRSKSQFQKAQNLSKESLYNSNWFKCWSVTRRRVWKHKHRQCGKKSIWKFCNNCANLYCDGSPMLIANLGAIHRALAMDKDINTK